MSDALSQAVILPFPVAQTRAPVVSEQARLRQALGQLDAAIADQRQALGEWRCAMAELSVGVSGLSAALTCYQQSLGEVQDGVAALRGEASKLGEWADGISLEVPATR